MEPAQLKISTKIGPLYLVASEVGLRGVFWQNPNIVTPPPGRTQTILEDARLQIHQYLEGSRKEFSIPLDVSGTEFQIKVWNQLATIPYGETRSYKDIAFALNDKNASRAVGTANGQNPLCLIVPCHRVISMDGSLGGYSGGLDIKAQLLDLEKTKSS